MKVAWARSDPPQIVGSILGQGIQLREYAIEVEENLRQVELESIQVT